MDKNITELKKESYIFMTGTICVSKDAPNYSTRSKMV